MDSRVAFAFFLCCIFHLFCKTQSLPEADLFLFGPASTVEIDAYVTESTASIQLSVPIVLHGTKHTTVHVSQKGIITFGQEAALLSDFRPFPLPFAAIAPFYADIDTETTGLIYFRESKTQESLDKANAFVHQSFPDQTAFHTKSVFVATWDDVPGFSNPQEWTNTFQLAVASSGEDSYAIFLYPTGNVVWAQFKSRTEGQPDLFAQAGFMSADGKVTALEGSGTDYLRALPNNKNPELAQEGVYAYRIGQAAVVTEQTRDGESLPEEEESHWEEETAPPAVTREPIDDLHPLDPANLARNRQGDSHEDITGHEEETGQSVTIPSARDPHHTAEEARVAVHIPDLLKQGNPVCANASECHANANCAPHTGGSCCECQPQFYGNGKLCFDKEAAQRMNGQVSGQLNGVPFADGMMHNYIVVQEGRVYVAYSPIPNEVGSSLQTILPVATVVGWMFAIPDTGVQNGLTITGGVFNHTATVRFTQSGQSVHVSQRFSGLDEHKMLHSVLYLSGTTPAVAAGQNIEFSDHNIDYRRSAAGTIQSFSTGTVKIGEESHPYTVEESIAYLECPHKHDPNAVPTSRLQVSRVVSLYQQQEKASRFGMDGKITLSGQAGSDVCKSVECGTSASCVPQADKAQCICNVGFQMIPGSDASVQPLNCVDINECATRNECSPHAECINSEGAFECRCLSGYTGNGQQCRSTEEGEPEDPCSSCDPNAECILDATINRHICQCRAGYTGSGNQCSASESEGDCWSQPELCGINAQCLRNQQGRPACVCFPGYVGDGRSCQLQSAAAPQVPSEDSCYHHPAQCAKNAACIPDDQGRGYACKCLQDYDGDGKSCRARVSTRGGFLAFTQGMSVVKLSLDRNSPDRGGQVAILPGQTVVGIAVDCAESWIVWSDIAGNTINRARYDGSGMEVLLRSIQSAEGLAIDPFSRNIFWTDSANDHIAVAKLSDVKAGHKVIISKNLSNPRALAIHPARGSIYWTDWNRLDPKIETANMDGSDRRVLINRDLGLPNALTVDLQTDDLCWADAGNQKIECASIDGNNRRMVFFGASYPFSITVYQDTLYWTDWTGNNIMSVRKSGGEAKTHELPLGSSGKVYGITAVPEQCPRLTNACASANGGCKFICLPLASGRRKCVCPDNIAADQCAEEPVYRS